MSEWTDARVPNARGELAESFYSVADAFAQNFEDELELGANFAVILDGKLIANICGGYTDRKKETPWSDDTITCIYSTGKSVLTLLVARAVSDGLLEYDAPVSSVWPEFAANGKSEITLAEVVSHQAGLAGLRDEMEPQTWLDWDAITARIAAMAPLWPPGSKNGYSPQLSGFVIGEVLRRVTRKTVGALIRDYDIDVYCGVSGDVAARASYMRKPPAAPDLGALNEFKKIAFLKRWSAPGRVAIEDWMAAELPASNMHANARALAEMVFPLANGGAVMGGEQIIREDVLRDVFRERIRGDDLVLPFNLSWSAGLMRNINAHFGPNENAFGHAGFGGSCVVIDPENRLTAAYVMNKMSPSLVGDPRAMRLIEALYDCLQ
ncbi:MAG: beta-lactamase family protein [Marinicaulis sp.]|nr:beta-lactamase family protein [Marinicaulis sp.]